MCSLVVHGQLFIMSSLLVVFQVFSVVVEHHTMIHDLAPHLYSTIVKMLLMSM